MSPCPSPWLSVVVLVSLTSSCTDSCPELAVLSSSWRGGELSECWGGRAVFFLSGFPCLPVSTSQFRACLYCWGWSCFNAFFPHSVTSHLHFSMDPVTLCLSCPSKLLIPVFTFSLCPVVAHRYLLILCIFPSSRCQKSCSPLLHCSPFLTVMAVCADSKAKPTSPWVPGAQGSLGHCVWSALAIRVTLKVASSHLHFFLHLRIFLESFLYLQKIQMFSDLFA